MRVPYNDWDDKAGLHGYVQFNKYTHTHTHTKEVVYMYIVWDCRPSRKGEQETTKPVSTQLFFNTPSYFIFCSLFLYFIVVVSVLFLCSCLVDVPLKFSCPAIHVQDWQPRMLLDMVQARSVSLKKKKHTHTHTHTHL